MDIPESSKSKKTRGLSVLLRELSDDEDNISTDTPPGVSVDPDQLWSQHFSAYMNASEQVPEGWSAIKWWRVCAHTPIHAVQIDLLYGIFLG